MSQAGLSGALDGLDTAAIYAVLALRCYNSNIVERCSPQVERISRSCRMDQMVTDANRLEFYKRVEKLFKKNLRPREAHVASGR